MFNQMQIIGNLTKDNDLKYLPSGSAVYKNSVATSHKWKDQSGQNKEEVMFMDIVIFGRSGEIANQYLRKGSKVFLTGRVVLENWLAQDGTKRSKHILRVETMKMLDSKGTGENHTYNPQDQPSGYSDTAESNHNYQSPGAMNQSLPEINIDEDEIPFAPIGLQYPYILHSC